MQLRKDGEEWYAKKSKKAKTWERVTDAIKWHGEDFLSIMGKCGRTEFHAYMGKHGNTYRQMYGVTSILNYWGECSRLVDWAVNKAVDHLEEVAELGLLMDDPQRIGKYLTATDLQQARKAHKQSLKKAGDAGTDVHSEIETLINFYLDNEHPVELDDGWSEQAFLFETWALDHNVKFLASEMPVFSKSMWLAGTFDALAEIDGKRWIIDIKTSNYVAPKHFLQCGAYAKMLHEMSGEAVDGLMIVHLPRSGGITIHKDTEVEECAARFTDVLRAVKWDKNKTYQLYG